MCTVLISHFKARVRSMFPEGGRVARKWVLGSVNVDANRKMVEGAEDAVGGDSVRDAAVPL